MAAQYRGALRADHLDHLRDGRSDNVLGASPVLDRIADGGVTFTRHFAVAPNTVPSTKSLFTGQYYLLEGRSKLPADGPETLAELFSKAGYRTAAFSGNGNLSKRHGNLRGFEHFQRATAETRGNPGFNNDAERVHAAALKWLDWLDQADDDKAFLYLHTIHPHNPFNPPEPFRSRFASLEGSKINGGTKTLLAIKRKEIAVSGPDRQRLKGLYAGGLAYNDSSLEGFFAELRRRYPAGEILFIVTSDHGEELFDHGGILHGGPAPRRCAPAGRSGRARYRRATAHGRQRRRRRSGRGRSLRATRS